MVSTLCDDRGYRPVVMVLLYKLCQQAYVAASGKDAIKDTVGIRGEPRMFPHAREAVNTTTRQLADIMRKSDQDYRLEFPMGSLQYLHLQFPGDQLDKGEILPESNTRVVRMQHARRGSFPQKLRNRFAQCHAFGPGVGWGANNEAILGVGDDSSCGKGHASNNVAVCMTGCSPRQWVLPLPKSSRKVDHTEY